MSVSFDYLQYTLRLWAEGIRVEIGKADKSPLSDAEQRQAFDKEMIAVLDKSEPQGVKKLSEQGFTLFCLGMGYGSSVAPKSMDKLAQNKLVDAWRNSVNRERHQLRYDIFESVLKQGVDRLGMKAVLAQFPQHGSGSMADVADALERTGFKSSYFKQGEVVQMIRSVQSAAAANPAKKSGPSA